MTFTLNFHEFLHTVYKYVLNSVAKFSLMFAQYFEYYAIILRGRFFVDMQTYVDILICLLYFPVSAMSRHISIQYDNILISVHNRTIDRQKQKYVQTYKES